MAHSYKEIKPVFSQLPVTVITCKFSQAYFTYLGIQFPCDIVESEKKQIKSLFNKKIKNIYFIAHSNSIELQLVCFAITQKIQLINIIINMIFFGNKVFKQLRRF